MLLTSQEIAYYRSQLAHYAEALIALDEIEDCEGDLNDAAINLGIQVGQQPDRNDWLQGLAKRCRVAICQGNFQEDLLNNQVAGVVGELLEVDLCPAILVTPIVLYVLKIGIQEFCEPLSLKLS